MAEAVTLNNIHEDLLFLKKEVFHLKTLLEEDLNISDDIQQEVQESRMRPKKDFISQEAMMKEFG